MPRRYLVLNTLALLTVGCGRTPEAPEKTPAPHDLSGTWERYPENWYGTDPDRPVLPGGPFDLKSPYAERYAAITQRQLAADKAGKPILSASSKCLPEGMPTIMGAIYPIEIVQSPKQMFVLAEFLSQVRRIRLDEAMPPAADIAPSYNGQSVAHWEGDTLVIETRGVRDDVRFYDMPHGANMVIRERIRRSAADRLDNEVTITDPDTLKTPYRFTFQYKKSDYRIQEFVCENNQLKVDADGGTALDVSTINE